MNGSSIAAGSSRERIEARPQSARPARNYSPGSLTDWIGVTWFYRGEEGMSAFISADMRGPHEGWLHIAASTQQLDQRIALVACPRNFGGRQWYFVCPYTSRRAMVLWMPPGASDFACRQRWGRQVAYVSQSASRIDRAYRGQAKITSRLCSIGGFDPEQWRWPPKPKWMRWGTYRRAEEKFDRYEAILDAASIAAGEQRVLNNSHRRAGGARR